MGFVNMLVNIYCNKHNNRLMADLKKSALDDVDYACKVWHKKIFNLRTDQMHGFGKGKLGCDLCKKSVSKQRYFNGKFLCNKCLEKEESNR